MISYNICLFLTYFTKHNTLSPSMLSQMAKLHSFLQLISFHYVYTYMWGGIYIYIYITHTYTYIPHLYPFICQQMTLRLIPYLGNFVNNAAMNIGCMNLFKVVFLFLSDTYPGVELLSHIVVVFIILRKKLCS